uniref:Uncharacterized protein n=1 Tax=Lotus japonicus TaxID=34305 RepID=I3S9G3_LOTJA|nr:unknown [Lotus japonicus]
MLCASADIFDRQPSDDAIGHHLELLHSVFC